MGNVPLFTSTAPWGMHVEFLFFTEQNACGIPFSHFHLHQAPGVDRHITVKELIINSFHRHFCALTFKNLSEMTEDFGEYSPLSRQTETSISIQSHGREEAHPAGCRKQFQMEPDLESDVESHGQISACMNIHRQRFAGLGVMQTPGKAAVQYLLLQEIVWSDHGQAGSWWRSHLCPYDSHGHPCMESCRLCRSVMPQGEEEGNRPLKCKQLNSEWYSNSHWFYPGHEVNLVNHTGQISEASWNHPLSVPGKNCTPSPAEYQKLFCTLQIAPLNNFHIHPKHGWWQSESFRSYTLFRGSDCQSAHQRSLLRAIPKHDGNLQLVTLTMGFHRCRLHAFRKEMAVAGSGEILKNYLSLN